ncbi:TIR domain-containing protein [Agrobacterium tumefaciens]|nr:TIR domain-containing protein [Agrobacterium tumefaciens]
MTKIFVSHAVADRHIAELLVDFFVEAIGVPAKDIFCSSMPGFGVPLTHDFNVNMRDQIQDPELVVLLMTPSYMDSQFCLMELGATWARSLRPLPVVVPPVSFSEVTRTLGLKQGWQINDSDLLQGVRRTVLEALGIQGNDNFVFDRKRKRWEADLTGALEKLAAAPKVLKATYDAAEATGQALRKSLDVQIEENKKLQHKLTLMERLRPVALIIESEPLIAQDISQILDQRGFTVAGIARTEREGVDMAARVKPDIITAEIVLADGSSGIDAVKKILTFTDAFPVFVTAYPEQLLRVERPEPAGLVVKPFAPQTLTAIIREGHEHLKRTWDRQDEVRQN